MKHHFADLLYREENYWTIVPNYERFAYSIKHGMMEKTEVRVLTISKHDENWKEVFDCPNLEELSLDSPTKEQVEAIKELKQLKRLRLSFFRAKDIEFIGSLENLEEVAFEYVSGFSDLSPMQKLKKLRSLHLENLRKVSNFDGLRGIDSLQYLLIDGTLDWNQPIDDFSFLEGLPDLEFLNLRFVGNKSEFPALLPFLTLKKLKRLMVGIATFSTKEYAFLNIALPHVIKGYTDDEISWSPYYQFNNGDIYFLGKGSRTVKNNSSTAADKKEAALRQFEIYIQEAEELIKTHLSHK
ncbi:leucine-rich repeat domain-containing protein [Chryseobacterium soli]|uniref:leucine-rich repeat domain-containing protein n=1 Tax=Chryseobacterium soli TaxID=445961 RepID=UPI002953C917|nr:leucine-rich repeat domain-containing protein [Chryseobacterium soli]MDV7695755.1 leucine-rich repeat domain-containing protein [Chryseobacterium soli]